MRPLDVFESGRERAERLVELYHHLYDRRQRRVRPEWARTIRQVMHWPKTRGVERVDGDGVLIVLHGAPGVTRRALQAEPLQELLRAAQATIVAALDRYVHEIVVQGLVRSLNRGATRASPALKKLRVPILVAKAAIDHARKPTGSSRGRRPMYVIRRGMQEVLHRDLTCQSPDQITDALAMVGVKALWTQCATGMRQDAEGLKRRLDGIVRRRNLIVHEGDIERKVKGGKLRLHDIKESSVRDDIAWITQFAKQIDRIAK